MIRRLSFILCCLAVFLLQSCSDNPVDEGKTPETKPFSYTIVEKDSISFVESECCSALRSSKEILDMVDASRGKIVFRDEINEKLIYAEFDAEDTSEVKFYDLNNGIDVFHPEISPDGEWVAFGTTHEGLIKLSHLYVQNLRTGKLLKLNVEGASVPRWHVLNGQDTVIVYMDICGLTNLDDWPTFSNWYVRFSNGEFSEPQKIFGGGSFNVTSDDFRFAVGGGATFYNRKLTMVDGEEKYVDTIWYNGEQVCNLSLAKDGSLRTSFLDMTGEEGVAFIGERYFPHKYIFVVDSLGKLIQAVESPSGYYFDHPEWISQGNFEVATLSDMIIHQGVALVDMTEGQTQVMEIVKGIELFHPYFWIDK